MVSLEGTEIGAHDGAPYLISSDQFETRRYKKRISGGTSSPSEVHWMIEHLKLYEFTGVQIKVTSGWSQLFCAPPIYPVHPNHPRPPSEKYKYVHIS